LRGLLKEGIVGVAEILLQIDREISHLQKARALLSSNGTAASLQPATATPRKSRKRKRNLTPEGRKRIADAVRRRWERQKKAAAGK
jgi:hypothetical protein